MCAPNGYHMSRYLGRIVSIFRHTKKNLRRTTPFGTWRWAWTINRTKSSNFTTTAGPIMARPTKFSHWSISWRRCACGRKIVISNHWLYIAGAVFVCSKWKFHSKWYFSAGCGRSGTFCALDLVATQLLNQVLLNWSSWWVHTVGIK